MHQEIVTRDWLDSAAIKRIRRSFGAVAADADRLTADFYVRLF